VECSPKSVTELFCVDCQRSYDLSRFSLQQRQHPDNAVSQRRHHEVLGNYDSVLITAQRCIECVQEVEDRVADPDDAVKEQEIVEQHRSMAASESTYSSVTGSAYSQSASLSQPHSVTGTRLYDNDGATSIWGDNSARPASPTNTALSAPRTNTTYSGGGTKNSFAKQGAYRPPLAVQAENNFLREQRQERAREESNTADGSDDSDDDDPY
jgi:hypothetical protein